MSQTLELSEVRDYMKGRLIEVFTTMLAMNVSFADKQEPPKLGERVSGSVGFGGDTLNGAVFLHLSSSLAARATSTMLGMSAEETPGDIEINDVVGEISNMLTGGLKSWFCDAGASCSLSTPGIIRGAYDVEPMPNVERTTLVFDCDGEIFAVEIHLKFVNSAS